MSFVLRRNGHWYIGFRDEAGRWKRQKSSAQTKEAAKRLAADEEALCERIRLGHSAPRERPHTWDDLCERYLTDEAPKHRSYVHMESAVRLYVAPAFKGRPLLTISPGDVEHWLMGLKGKMQDSTREQRRMRMQAVFAFAVKKLKWLAVSPMQDVARVSVPKRRPKHLTMEEMESVLKAAGDLKNCLVCAFTTGLRKGELAGLRREDLDFARRIIHVRRSFDGPTKTGRESSIPMPEQLVPFLMEQLESHEDDWVFPAPKGGMRPRIWNTSRAFRKVMKDAGVELHGRSWRHTRSTLGTLLYQATGDIHIVQRMLRHSTVQVTADHYADATPEHIAKGVEKLGVMVSPYLLPEQASVAPASVEEVAECSNTRQTTTIDAPEDLSRNQAHEQTSTRIAFDAVLYIPVVSRTPSPAACPPLVPGGES